MTEFRRMLMFLTSRVILSEGFVPASIFFVPLQKQIAAQKMLAPQEIQFPNELAQLARRWLCVLLFRYADQTKVNGYENTIKIH